MRACCRAIFDACSLCPELSRELAQMSARVPGDAGVGGASGTHCGGGCCELDVAAGGGLVCVGVVMPLPKVALGIPDVFALDFFGEVMPRVFAHIPRPGVLIDNDSRGVFGVMGSCSGGLLEK